MTVSPWETQLTAVLKDTAASDNEDGHRVVALAPPDHQLAPLSGHQRPIEADKNLYIHYI